MSGQNLTIPIGLRYRRKHCVNYCSHCDTLLVISTEEQKQR